MNASVSGEEQPATGRRHFRNRLAPSRIIKWSALALLVVATLLVARHYWQQSRLYVTTDNAYLNADMVRIAAQVSGPVTAVAVRDQQTVHAGDLLFEVDPRPFELALANARAQLELARQSVGSESAAVAAAHAQLAQREAELRIAQSNVRRTRDLIARHLVSEAAAETTSTQAETAAAAVKAAEANLDQAISSLGDKGERNPNVRAALTRVEQAKLDLEHTRIVAPADGVIANLSLRPGSTVQAQVALFALIGNKDYWVDANFKETELEHVIPGEPATIVMDMYRDHPFQGEVQSLSGGSGTAFSLLPAQNATGNWVKVTQRVPVRVRILDPAAEFPLRVGTTGTVKIHIKQPL